MFLLSSPFFLTKILDITCIFIYRTVREAPLKKIPNLFGHCPNSYCTPCPALKRALWGSSFLDKCPKPFWKGFITPQNQANSSLNSYPIPYGQALRLVVETFTKKSCRAITINKRQPRLIGDLSIN